MSRLTDLRRSEDRSRVVRALANPTRLLIVEALEDGEACVNTLTALTDFDVSTVSKHLAVLRGVGLVQTEKRGLNVFYRLACPCLSDFFSCIDQINRSQSERPQRVAG
ncbi:MAG TPA: metalloregulator ArsR/SmtB family transcription factor [Opitutaceae bacterium]|nr:metalloregulator ArsR/SmtB family transcription factor [Opitutaceae bacterium]